MDRLYRCLSWVICLAALGFGWLSFVFPLLRPGIKELGEIGVLWVVVWWTTTPTICILLIGRTMMHGADLSMAFVAREGTKWLFALEAVGIALLFVTAGRFFASDRAPMFKFLGFFQLGIALALLVYSYWGYKVCCFHKAALRAAFYFCDTLAFTYGEIYFCVTTSIIFPSVKNEIVPWSIVDKISFEYFCRRSTVSGFGCPYLFSFPALMTAYSGFI
jgi:hypothetical protein